LPDQKAVFVVDDDPSILTSVKQLLRAHGYESLLCSSAKEFADHDHFEDACYFFRYQPSGRVGHRSEVWPYCGLMFSAGHIHDRERQHGCSRCCTSIRLHRLSHKTVLGKVADPANRESICELTKPTRHGTLSSVLCS
jgi:hypothetical protein